MRVIANLGSVFAKQLWLLKQAVKRELIAESPRYSK
jgi:hypothetical protein